MTDGSPRRELAKIGVCLEDQDGEVWETCLRALASPRGQEPLSPEHLETVSGQVYAETEREEPPSAVVMHATDYPRVFVDAYGLEDLGDVDDLLGRESFERDNYVGRVAMLSDRSEEEIVDSILDNVSPPDDGG